MGFFKKIRNSKASKVLMAAGLAAFMMGQSAQALPQGGTVVHGNATVNVNGQNMTIQQATQQAIINWNGFSISAGELVKFLQPSAAAAVLNRVTGVDPSVINGILQGNGNIFLINPNGVLIGPGGMVNAGGFLASTLELSNADFLSGNMHFKQAPGKDLAAVVNQGEIRVTDGGFVVLMAPSVANEGLILAQNGEVALGAGKEATLNFDGRNLIHFAMAEGPAGTGTVVMSQASANNVLAQVVNNLGIEEAGSLSVDGSVISSDILLQANGNGDLTVQSASVVGDDITVSNSGGDIFLNSQAAFDGGSIRADAGGDITFHTLIAEPLNGQGGVVELNAGGTSGTESISPQTEQTPSSVGNIIMESGGQGIAADQVLLNATGDISTTIAANSVAANTQGNVSLTLQPGVIDGQSPIDTPTPDPTSTPTPTPSPSPDHSSSNGLLSSGNQRSLSTPPGGSKSSSSNNSRYPSLGSSSSSGESSSSSQTFVTIGSNYSSPSPSPSPTSSPSPAPESPGLTGQQVLAQVEPAETDGIATLVGTNGTLVTVNAGGNVVVDSVNTVIVDRISGRNVSVRSQTGSVVDNGDIVGADNRDIIASESANLSAKDFLGTVDDPLEVDIAGDLDVFAANEVDGISGVLVGLVGGEYIQDSDTAGIVLLNPGSSLTDGIAQAQRGVMDNTLPGDQTIGGGSVANLFYARLVNSIEEEDWLEILRGTVVWEDSEDEATEEDL